MAALGYPGMAQAMPPRPPMAAPNFASAQGQLGSRAPTAAMPSMRQTGPGHLSAPSAGSGMPQGMQRLGPGGGSMQLQAFGAQGQSNWLASAPGGQMQGQGAMLSAPTGAAVASQMQGQGMPRAPGQSGASGSANLAMSGAVRAPLAATQAPQRATQPFGSGLGTNSSLQGMQAATDGDFQTSLAFPSGQGGPSQEERVLVPPGRADAVPEFGPSVPPMVLPESGPSIPPRSSVDSVLSNAPRRTSLSDMCRATFKGGKMELAAPPSDPINDGVDSDTFVRQLSHLSEQARSSPSPRQQRGSANKSPLRASPRAASPLIELRQQAAASSTSLRPASPYQRQRASLSDKPTSSGGPSSPSRPSPPAPSAPSSPSKVLPQARNKSPLVRRPTPQQRRREQALFSSTAQASSAGSSKERSPVNHVEVLPKTRSRGVAGAAGEVQRQGGGNSISTGTLSASSRRRHRTPEDAGVREGLRERPLASGDPWTDTGKLGSKTSWFAESLRNPSTVAGARRSRSNSPQDSRSVSHCSNDHFSDGALVATQRLAMTDTISSRHRRREREAAATRSADYAAKERAVEEAAAAVLNGEVAGSEAAALALEALGNVQGGIMSVAGAAMTPRNENHFKGRLAHGNLTHTKAIDAWRGGLRGPYLTPAYSGRPTASSQLCLSISSRLAGGSERLDRLPGRFLAASSGVTNASLGPVAPELPELEADNTSYEEELELPYRDDLYMIHQGPEAFAEHLRYPSQGTEERSASGPASQVDTPRDDGQLPFTSESQQSFMAATSPDGFIRLGEEELGPAA